MSLHKTCNLTAQGLHTAQDLQCHCAGPAISRRGAAASGLLWICLTRTLKSKALTACAVLAWRIPKRIPKFEIVSQNSKSYPKMASYPKTYPKLVFGSLAYPKTYPKSRFRIRKLNRIPKFGILKLRCHKPPQISLNAH